MTRSECTTDPFLNGRLRVTQDRDGYRFSMDAVLLAHHVCPRPGARLLDLGTGCGIISMIIARRCPDVEIFAVEIQKRLAALAEKNIRGNGLARRVHICCNDMFLERTQN